ncbi:MAG: fructose-bisphosphate aldolase, class II, partial [Parcubacteria group bacterium Athens0714_26]
MKKLRDFIKEAEVKKIAIGHFNISDWAAAKAIFEVAKELSVRGGPAFGGSLPVIIGTSEGEADFLGRKQIVAFVRSLREEYFSGGDEFPVFLNADHIHSLEKVKAAVAAGYDAILFDGGKLPFEENIKATKEVVEYVRSVNPEILVEGE